MPVCFQLINKETGKADVLQRIDDMLWHELGHSEPQGDDWYLGWYIWCGYNFASGRVYDDVLDYLLDYVNDCDELDRRIEVLAWLEKRYDISCWHER